MIELKQIGVIRSPYTELAGMPIQPAVADDARGTVELYEEYAEGLQDLDGFSHVILLYQFHLSSGFDLTLVPFMDSIRRGVFSTRAPRRPNPLGMSVVRLERIDDRTLHVIDIDVLDGTPLLDIKPYVPAFDSPGDLRVGWLEHNQATVRRRSDDRFE